MLVERGKVGASFAVARSEKRKPMKVDGWLLSNTGLKLSRDGNWYETKSSSIKGFQNFRAHDHYSFEVKVVRNPVHPPSLQANKDGWRIVQNDTMTAVDEVLILPRTKNEGSRFWTLEEIVVRDVAEILANPYIE